MVFFQRVVLAVLALAMFPAVAFSEGTPFTGSVTESQVFWRSPWEPGEFTESNPVVSRVVTFPIRLVTGVVGVPVGAVIGLGNGLAEGFKVNKAITFDKIPSDTDSTAGNVALSTAKTPFLVPAGVAGAPVFSAAGGVIGTMNGVTRGFTKGFMLPDKL